MKCHFVLFFHKLYSIRMVETDQMYGQLYQLEFCINLNFVRSTMDISTNLCYPQIDQTNQKLHYIL